MPKDPLATAPIITIGSGFFGKLPARGDFVMRGIVREFIDALDLWLQHSMASSKQHLGDRWLDCYLTSPLWRFALNSGACGKIAHTGVLMPSVDRVGRYFPLAIAAPLPDGANFMDLLSNADAWFRRVEQVILQALQDDLDLEAFADQVSALTAPRVSRLPRRASSRIRKPLHLHIFEPKSFYSNALAQHLHQCQSEPYSLWWTKGSDLVSPCLNFCSHMPGSQEFSAMLDGRWSDWGWQRVSVNMRSPSPA